MNHERMNENSINNENEKKEVIFSIEIDNAINEYAKVKRRFYEIKKLGNELPNFKSEMIKIDQLRRVRHNELALILIRNGYYEKKDNVTDNEMLADARDLASIYVNAYESLKK